MDQYNGIMWEVEGIQTTLIGYGDGHKRVVFASSEGSYIEQQRIDVSLRLSATARDGAEVQQAGVSLGQQRRTSPWWKGFISSPGTSPRRQ